MFDDRWYTKLAQTYFYQKDIIDQILIQIWFSQKLETSLVKDVHTIARCTLSKDDMIYETNMFIIPQMMIYQWKTHDQTIPVLRNQSPNFGNCWWNSNPSQSIPVNTINLH